MIGLPNRESLLKISNLKFEFEQVAVPTSRLNLVGLHASLYIKILLLCALKDKLSKHCLSQVLVLTRKFIVTLTLLNIKCRLRETSDHLPFLYLLEVNQLWLVVPAKI